MDYVPPLSNHHIPKPVTAFVGRQTEVIDITNRLADSACNLLTLTGMGGIGKTRLAIEVANSYAEADDPLHRQRFPDGLSFVSLAPLTSSDLLATSIMDKLGLTVSVSSPIRDQLLSSLENKVTLLILDNFEHLLAGTQLISDILSRAPNVTILVTSRTRLNLPEEEVYELQGMPVPATDDVQPIESYSALLLFQQIAQKVDWRFALNNEQIPHAIRICRLVGGIPLAIEMAAAWLRLLSCRQIAEDLSQNFALLEATLGHIPQRHQSIRLVFEYSWALLSDQEQAIFQKMSIFRGGFTREAAEGITGASVDSLQSFMDKSLLDEETEGRYSIHELLRQYAEEKLLDQPELVQETHDLHCYYYADFLDKLKADFVINDYNLPSIIAMNADFDNLRVMWDWALSHHKFEAIECASESLYHYFRIRDYSVEAVTLFKKALDLVIAENLSSEHDRLIASLSGMLAIHTNFCSLSELTAQIAEEGKILARQYNMSVAEARCVTAVGDDAYETGDYLKSRDYLEEGARLYQEIGESYEIQYVRLRLAKCYQTLGEFDLASQTFKQLIASGKQNKVNGQVAWALVYLGFLENALGHYRIGQQHFTEAQEIFEQMNWLVGLAVASTGLATTYCNLEDYHNSRRQFHRALTANVAHGLQTKALIMLGLTRIAYLLASEGDVTRAVEIVSFALHTSYSNDETRGLARKLYDELQSELPSIVFQSATDRGLNLEFKALIMSLIDEFSEDPADLTAIETNSGQDLDLLEQVAKGLSSGELFDKDLSEQEQRTVHNLVDAVDNLLEKEKAKIMASFMESASHDLRTPLTIINTSIYLLERITDPDKQKNRLNLVKEQVSHLQNLIESLIAMARLDGGTELYVEPLDLNQLLISLQESNLTALRTGRDLDIALVLDTAPLMVSADIEKLEQAFLNIIENAIIYTPDGGAIRIELSSDLNSAIFEVRDTGIGIGEDDLPHIFERFYQVDKARTERGRCGLGLAITQKVIDMHHGSVGVHSEINQGSTFRVLLPLKMPMT